MSHISVGTEKKMVEVLGNSKTRQNVKYSGVKSRDDDALLMESKSLRSYAYLYILRVTFENMN